MAVIGANRSPTASPMWTRPWALYAGLFIIATSILWAAAVTMASANLKASFQDEAQRTEAVHQQRIDNLRQADLRSTATAVAASVKPLMTLRGDVPEITDRTLQSVVAGLLAGGEYSFVAIIDGRRQVLASSDLALIGKRIPDTTRPNAVEATVGSYPWVGSVILAPQPKS